MGGGGGARMGGGGGSGARMSGGGAARMGGSGGAARMGGGMSAPSRGGNAAGKSFSAPSRSLSTPPSVSRGGPAPSARTSGPALSGGGPSLNGQAKGPSPGVRSNPSSALRSGNAAANAGVAGNNARPGKSTSPSIKPPANNTVGKIGAGQPGGNAGKVVSTLPNPSKAASSKPADKLNLTKAGNGQPTSNPAGKPLAGAGKPGGVAGAAKTAGSAVNADAPKHAKPGAAPGRATGPAGKALAGKGANNNGTKLNNANKHVTKPGGSAPGSNLANVNGKARNNPNAGQLTKQNWKNQHNNWNQHCARNYNHNWYRGCSSGFRPWFYPSFGIGLGYGWGYGGVGLGYGYGGFGYTPWGCNLLAYRWGYSPYVNPYCSSYSYPYNYSQPVIINYAADYSATPSTVVEPAVAGEAVATDLDAARDAFRAGDYAAAIDAADRAIKATPEDPAPHELRALALFAVGRYEEAAAGLNALLAVAPGWNWETMRAIYPDAATYTKQLRSLEAFVREHPDSAAGNFVLGYHYLVTNYTDAARKKLQRVVELEPKDRVAAQLLKGLDDKAAPPAMPEDAAPSDVETDIAGSWSARQGDARLQLSINDDGTFTWVAPAGKEERTITGKYTLAGNVLVLEAESGETMVAKVTAVAADKFHFRFVGGPGDDPGVDFERTTTEPPAPREPAIPEEEGEDL